MDAYLHPLSPFRPPHWRWTLSKDCIDGPVGYWRYVDEPIREAAAYRWRKLQGEDVTAEPIAIAYDIRKEDNARRAELEARLLARQTPEIIAGKMGIGSHVVEQYALLFFDLPPEGYGNDWLVMRVLRLHSFAGRDPHEFELWRWIGWQVGPLGVDLLVEAYRSGTSSEVTDMLRAGMQIATETFSSAPPSEKYLAAADRLLQRLGEQNDPELPAMQVMVQMLHLMAGRPQSPEQPKSTDKATGQRQPRPATDAEIGQALQELGEDILMPGMTGMRRESPVATVNVGECIERSKSG